jgi:hypothetical protein
MSGPRRVEPPVFYPTLEEMKTMSLEKYVESIEEQLEEYGIGRIVPPKGWTPRRRGYDDVDFTVEKAITQHATGRKGLFRTLLVEKKPLSIKNDFKPMAELPENQPSKAAMEDPTHAALEREFWKKVAYDPPTYCADVAGTLFDQPEEKEANDGDSARRRRRDARDGGVGREPPRFAFKSHFAGEEHHAEGCELVVPVLRDVARFVRVAHRGLRLVQRELPALRRAQVLVRRRARGPRAV